MLQTKSSFHITIKPTGALCNLACTYCYYLHKKSMLDSRRKMDDATLETFIRQYIASQPTNAVFFTWHGGEPTLLGIDFFEKVLRLQRKYANGRAIENDLQTNGVLLDDTWCRFLKEHKFLVGLSIDGPEDLNACRKTLDGQHSVDDAVKAAECLRRHRIPFNTLTVIHHDNAKKPLEVYYFLKNIIGSRHMQFIPCVEPKNFMQVAPLTWDDKTLPTQGTSAARPRTENSFLTDFTVDPGDWGHFLSAVFDEWYGKDQGEVFIYLFENFLSLWLKRGAMACLFDDTCGHAMALDRDGSMYACDHFCYPAYKYGNIQQDDLRTIATSPKRQAFSTLKSRLPKQCGTCRWLSYCNGECPKKRFLKTSEGETGLNYLCDGYRLFFDHIKDKMKTLCLKYGN